MASLTEDLDKGTGRMGGELCKRPRKGYTGVRCSQCILKL